MFAHQEYTLESNIQREVPVRLGKCFHCVAAGNTRAVDKYVDPSEFLNNGVNQSFAVGFFCDVAFYENGIVAGRGYFTLDTFCKLFVDVSHHHGYARIRKKL